MDRRLGEPLPHQLSNPTRAHPCTIKSLITETCDSVMLCGISSRFQLLSPAQGQVAHALLTRPPLSNPRRNCSVRLECVMHAASVHPEPGSNSQTICISSAVAVRSFFVWAIYSSFFYFLELCSLLLVFWQICISHLLFCFVLLSFVVQLSSFNSAPPFAERLSIISQPLYFVNTFLKFFSKFFSTSFCRNISPSLSRQLYYSTTSSLFCQGFFLIFSHFVKCL